MRYQVTIVEAPDNPKPGDEMIVVYTELVDHDPRQQIKLAISRAPRIRRKRGEKVEP